MKKYRLLKDETIKIGDRVLYRIEAVRSFSYANKGDRGGFIESEKNLSHSDNAWVFDNARVYGDARVCGNAMVYNNARVCGNAMVFDNAWVYGDARVCGNAMVYDNARIYGNAKVCGNAWIFDDAMVYDNARIYDNAKVYGEAKVCGNAMVHDYARVYGNVEIVGDAKVRCNEDYIVFKNWWSSGRYFTWTRTNNKWKVGCFYGTGEDLIRKAYADNEKSGREYERVVNYVSSIMEDEEQNSN